MRLSASAFAFLTTLAALAAAAPAANPPPDSRWQAEVLATGMAQPMELERAPDGRIFFIELAGRLRIWKPDTRTVTEAATIPAFTEQENGLLGFALDPQFATNQWIY
ncbi:MAG: PQQ-dependent sugar dehydrogenase, partial [Verrucomicrobiota bacterium]